MSKESKAKPNQDIKNLLEEAQAELSSLGTIHKFEIKEAVVDKLGEKTKSFEIDLDKPGIIGKLAIFGDVVSQDGDGIKEDSEKLFTMLKFISNIELTDENIDIIGYSVLDAREIAKGFFTLKLVIRTLKGAMEQSSFTQTQQQEKA